MTKEVVDSRRHQAKHNDAQDRRHEVAGHDPEQTAHADSSAVRVSFPASNDQKATSQIEASTAKPPKVMAPVARTSSFRDVAIGQLSRMRQQNQNPQEIVDMIA